MQKLIQVEDAKALMKVAKEDWSVWRWLLEKKRVRAAADRANEALDSTLDKAKEAWGDDFKKAYRELEALAESNGDAKSKRLRAKAAQEASGVDPEVKAAAHRMKETDDTAYDARMDAEDTFDEAERRLSTSMAREGAEKAILSWELYEKAIRKAEAVARRK